MSKSRGVLVVAAAALGVAGVLTVQALRGAESAAGCTRYAAPTGDDGAPGTRDRPFRTVQRLVDRLRADQTGCLLAGRFVGDVRFRRGGQAGKPLVLRSAPDDAGRVVVNGIVEIDDTANHVVLEGLVFDGRRPPGGEAVVIKIYGDDAVLRGNEIYAGGERICVATGDANGRFGIAWRPLIERNRIHDCGNRAAGSRGYPSGHALYLQADRHALVRDNVIYDTNYGGRVGGRGIQLWPDSEHATIEHNVVDNANQWSVLISGGDYPTGTTRGALVRNNVLTNAVEHNVASGWWGVDPTGGNEVVGNCVWGAGGSQLAWGTWLGRPAYAARANVEADPGYVDLEAKDFRLRAGSPCEGKGPRDERVAAGPYAGGAS